MASALGSWFQKCMRSLSTGLNWASNSYAAALWAVADGKEAKNLCCVSSRKEKGIRRPKAFRVQK